MPEKWLFEVSLWKVTKALILYEIIHVSLFLWLEELKLTKIVKDWQGSDKDWHLTSWTKYNDTESCHL